MEAAPIKTKEETLESAIESYKYFSEQAEFFKRLIVQGGGVVPSNHGFDFKAVRPLAEILEHSIPVKRRRRIGGTFASAIIECLELSDRPQYTGDLIKMVKDFGRTVSSSKNFASQLNTASKKNPEIMKELVDGRVVWGLAKWFEKGHLKEEYVSQILRK